MNSLKIKALLGCTFIGARLGLFGKNIIKEKNNDCDRVLSVTHTNCIIADNQIIWWDPCDIPCFKVSTWSIRPTQLYLNDKLYKRKPF